MMKALTGMSLLALNPTLRLSRRFKQLDYLTNPHSIRAFQLGKYLVLSLGCLVGKLGYAATGSKRKCGAT
jgi:hypothetical protein